MLPPFFRCMVCLLFLYLSGCTTQTHLPKNVPNQKTDIAAYNPSEYSYAYGYFEHWAKAGNPVAEDNLGKIYADGRGVAENPALSVEWYTKAAMQHNADAELNLGVAELYGRGTAQNKAAACQWIASAKKDGSQFAKTFYTENCVA